MDILYLVVFFSVFLSCRPIYGGEDNNTGLHQQARNGTREDRFMSLFYGVGTTRFKNSACDGDEDLKGTCYTFRQCLKYGGATGDYCARRLGTCCTFKKSCGSTTKVNSTYFSNPGFPLGETGGRRCTISVKKCGENICQLRLDFLVLSLAPPDASGNCVDDVLLVEGGASKVPRICGDNTDLHVYVDFPNNDEAIDISMMTSSSVSDSRRWNIDISQIACDSAEKAPSGCLMYHTSKTGSVKSFNYAKEKSEAQTPSGGGPGTRELSNLDYGVCVRVEPGYCSIEWKQTADFSFVITGDAEVLDPMDPTISEALSGQDCMKDFVVIPNAKTAAGIPTDDRFCGTRFDSVTTEAKPFVLTVVTNADELAVPPETPDFGNTGFSLDFAQKPC